MDLVEILGFVSGALCVWLVARQNPWNWPIGMANNITFLVLFWSAGLYADSGLQVVYLGLAVYGWWAWLRGGVAHTTLTVTRTSTHQWLMLAGVGVLGTVGLTVLLDTVTDSTVPLPDAITTVLSLLATWGQARKKLESWWLWITADVIYIPLYAYKDLWLTAALYVGFLALCVLGLRNWRASLRMDEARGGDGSAVSRPGSPNERSPGSEGSPGNERNERSPGSDEMAEREGGVGKT